MLQTQIMYTYDGDNMTGIDKDRVFAPVCLLNHKYHLNGCPEYYFIVRKAQWQDSVFVESNIENVIYEFSEPELERVCLYQEGVINKALRGNAEPFDLWISNELRDGRRIERIYSDMELKASELVVRAKLKINF